MNAWNKCIMNSLVNHSVIELGVSPNKWCHNGVDGSNITWPDGMGQHCSVQGFMVMGYPGNTSSLPSGVWHLWWRAEVVGAGEMCGANDETQILALHCSPWFIVLSHIHNPTIKLVLFFFGHILNWGMPNIWALAVGLENYSGMPGIKPKALTCKAYDSALWIVSQVPLQWNFVSVEENI